MCRMPADVFGEPFEMPYWLTRPIGPELRAKLSEEQRELYTQLYEATTAWAELQTEVDQATARGKAAVSAEQTVQQQFLKAQEKAAKTKKAMSAQERDGWFSRINNASKRREEMCQAAVNKQSELRVPMSEKHMKAVALWAPVINHYRSKDKDSSVRDLLKKIKEQEATK
jgi:cation transport regulator ChaB